MKNPNKTAFLDLIKSSYVPAKAAFVIAETLQAVLVLPECILIACLAGPSRAAGARPLPNPQSASDRG